MGPKKAVIIDPRRFSLKCNWFIMMPSPACSILCLLATRSGFCLVLCRKPSKKARTKRRIIETNSKLPAIGKRNKDACMLHAQDTGCNTASLHDFLETLPYLEGKDFQVVTWLASRPRKGCFNGSDIPQTHHSIHFHTYHHSNVFQPDAVFGCFQYYFRVTWAKVSNWESGFPAMFDRFARTSVLWFHMYSQFRSSQVLRSILIFTTTTSWATTVFPSLHGEGAEGFAKVPDARNSVRIGRRAGLVARSRWNLQYNHAVQRKHKQPVYYPGICNKVSTCSAFHWKAAGVYQANSLQDMVGASILDFSVTAPWPSNTKAQQCTTTQRIMII